MVGRATDDAAGVGRTPADAEVLRRALADLPAWLGDTSGLVRTVTLADFPTAIAVVDRVAAIAEELDHHPDIDIRWRTLTFRLVTHVAGNRVTTRDIELAGRIDAVIRDASA